MTRILLLSTALLATLASVATAGGQSPGAASVLTAGGIRYLASPDGGSTTLAAQGRTGRLDGRWGFPRVTFNGDIEGRSRDGRTLVLVRPLQEGRLASPSEFAILDARTLKPRKLLTLPGRLAYDAIAADGRKLYLVEYVSVVGELRYRVRLYDVATERLQRRAIADKRSRWTTMEGLPFARATSGDGTWVYTLYGGEEKAFVHALNVREGYAMCIDLPGARSEVEPARLRLRGGTLSVVAPGGATLARIDTESLRVLPNP